MTVEFTLGKRIALGIALMLVLMVAVGAVGYWGLTGILRVTGFSQQINRLNTAVDAANSYSGQYLLSIYTGDHKLHESSAKAVAEQLAVGLRIIDAIKTRSDLTAKGTEQIASAAQEIKSFGKHFNQYGKVADEKAAMEASIGKIFPALLTNISNGQLRINAMTLAVNVLKNSLANYFRMATESNWSTVQAKMEKANKAISAWQDFVAHSKLASIGEKINKQFLKIKGFTERYHAMTLSQQRLKKAMEGHTRKLNSMCTSFIKLSTQEMHGQTRTSIRLIFGGLAFALLIGILYAVFSIRGIVGRLKSVIKGVSEGAGQVTSASSQVSSASHQLAEGSSEHAASLEETSSSLEQMASMTRQNADNAAQANRLMLDASTVADQANQSMIGLTDSMNEISKASEETQKIIKTIDEIAFQTNLLALNAAVEAARAGEAGAGFAVVADEVRNLAMRAAEAAKNTATIIDETTKKVADGSSLVEVTNEKFGQVAATVKKSEALVGEIAAASHEQAQGIEQINQAVSEMDRVIQHNTSSVEETASASEQMNAQAGQLMEFIADLAALVSGTGSSGQETHVTAAADVEPARRMIAPAVSARSVGQPFTQSSPGTWNAEEAIALSHDDFTDF